MSQGSQPYGQYEFNKAENAVIGAAGGWVNASGTIHLVLGVLVAIGAAKAVFGGFRASGAWAIDVVYVAYAVFFLFLGVNFRRAGIAFKRVVDTQGNDIPSMMQALEALGNAFKALVICTLMGAFLVTVAVITAMSLPGR